MNFSRAWKVVTAPSVPMHKTPDTRHRINHTINLARATTKHVSDVWGAAQITWK